MVSFCVVGLFKLICFLFLIYVTQLLLNFLANIFFSLIVRRLLFIIVCVCVVFAFTFVLFFSVR